MLNHDLYILVKCIEKTKETIGRKFPGFASEQLGDLWLIGLWDGRQSAPHCIHGLVRSERPISPYFVDIHPHCMLANAH